MYFSKVELDKNSPTLLETLEKLRQQNGYHFHQLIWRLFADSKWSDKKRDFLFRQENQGLWSTLYIVSHTLPKDMDNIWSIQTKPYVPQLLAGQKLYFSLRANPRQVITQADGKKKYCDAVMHLKQQYKAQQNIEEKKRMYDLIQEAGIGWLKQRSERHGFKLLHAIADGYQQHKLQKSSHLIQFSTLDYQGQLEIIDVESFLNTLTSGIGAAKGFGCGLILIKR